MPLTNCQVNLILTSSENCVLTSKTTKDADPAVAAIDNSASAIFQITDTLSAENDKRLLEQLRTVFKRTIKWNKYRSEMTN